MLTQVSRAKRKQVEAIILEQDGKFKQAGSYYSIAKVIWASIKGIATKKQQQFCESRSQLCANRSLVIHERDDDDELF